MSKPILIKSFLTGVLYDRFKLIHAYLNEGDKVRECYSCLKTVIQAHFYVGFFTTFFIKRASLKWFYWCMKFLQSSTVFKQKINHEVSRWKFLHESFCNSQFKKYDCNSMHCYNRKIWDDIASSLFSFNNVINFVEQIRF